MKEFAAMTLTNKICIITGSASGIGLGVARRYLAAGAKVAIADLNAAAADAVAAELNAQYPGNALAVAMDVTSEESVNAGVAAVVAKWGTVDVLVSNAGVQIVDPIDQYSFANWKKMLAIHLDGAFLTSKACIQHMYKQNSGAIILMGSVHSKEASVLKAPYVTAKHGLMGLNKLIAYAQLTGQAVSLQLAEEQLTDILSANRKRITIDEIQRTVCQFYRVDRTEMSSKRRARAVVRPRQVAMYLAKVLTPRSYPEIGRKFGGRDHSTVIHAVRLIEDRVRYWIGVGAQPTDRVARILDKAGIKERAATNNPKAGEPGKKAKERAEDKAAKAAEAAEAAAAAAAAPAAEEAPAAEAAAEEQAEG